MANRDLKLFNSILSSVSAIAPHFFDDLEIADGRSVEHPLDEDIQNELKHFQSIMRDEDDDYRLYNYIDNIKLMWKTIIEKAIKCLRFFDTREPFLLMEDKHPVAYGINELSNYFEKYTQFESMLYGGGKYYRDHVIHVFRTWLLGIDCLLDNDGAYLKRITLQKGFEINNLEKLSIWSIIALTHDLGYPLEKSQSIIEKTKEMMKSFINNPTVLMDLSFNGIQNNMNDFVVRFLSSKMHPKAGIDKEKFVARLQPKYYFKFQKSLEGYNHGILSSIIIYKLLIYFLESDFNINEDYEFDKEDARQFYIRREILRTIASHTCHDVYHLDMLSFAFLLIMVDDAQEWGRKRISELYVKRNSIYEFESITPSFEVDTYEINETNKITIHSFNVSEKFSFVPNEENNMKEIFASLFKQNLGYKEIFRDGQDTAKRNFNFEKKTKIEFNGDKKVNFVITMNISNKNKPLFTIYVQSENPNELKKYDKKYFEKIFESCIIKEKSTAQKEKTFEIIENK